MRVGAAVGSAAVSLGRRRAAGAVTGLAAAGLLLSAAGPAAAQERTRSFVRGAVTADAVERALVLVPDGAGTPDGPSEVSLALTVEFAFDSADLTGGAMRDLDEVAAALGRPALQSVRLTLEGHTDATGGAEYNLRLSQRRAESVVSYLVRRGVAAGRLQPAGFGEYRPLPGYAPEDGRQRRVELVRGF